MSNWPEQDYASMVKFFGRVGENQTRLVLPYPMVLTWEPQTTIKSITCHEKVADALRSIFQKTLDEYGLEKIEALGLHHFSGCLNVRKMRGGSAWSIHSWGAAVDIDDERNTLHQHHDSAVLARKEYVPFWRIVESEGAQSLGRVKDYDWMHFQFARLP